MVYLSESGIAAVIIITYYNYYLGVRVFIIHNDINIYGYLIEK